MPKLDLLKQVNERTGTQDSGSVSLTVKDLLIGDIDIKSNVRQEYTGIDDLKASIKQHGLLNPITVYKSGDTYAVKTGHRRYIAVKALYKENPDKFNKIRCIISDGDNIQAIQLIENIQRENLKSIELYKALKDLKGQGLTLKQIADIIGKQESTIKKLFTSINDIDKDTDIKKTFTGYAGVTMDDIQETKGIKDKGKRLDILKEKGKGNITRKQLRQKTKELKPDNKKQENGQIEINADNKELFIEMFFTDKKTYNFIANEIKRLCKNNNIKITKRI